jgi:interferon gamma-inducible protein 30
MFFSPISSSSPVELTLASKIAAVLVASILLHGFLFHGSAWKSRFYQVPGSNLFAVKVKILTEALCSDCKQFVGGQLSEVYNALGPSVMDLQIVPFGNAKFVRVDGAERGEKPVLQCQHGVAECDGNVYEQCAVMQLYPYAQRYLPFLRCLYDELPMGHSDELLDRDVIANCSTASDLDWVEIAECHDDEKQVALLQRRAKSQTPSYHKGVPWVEVNGRHVEITDDGASLLRAVCRAFISNGGVHPSCSSSLVV